MTVGTHARLPLVLAATRRALEEAAELLPAGTILENVVGDAIASGELHTTPRIGGRTRVYLRDLRVVVSVERVLSPFGRKAWRPIGVTRERGANR